MLNLGRPFNLYLPQAPGEPDIYSDLFPALFITAKATRNDDGDVTFAVVNIDGQHLRNSASVRLQRLVAAHFDDPHVSNTPHHMQDILMVLLDPFANARQRFTALRRLCPGVTPALPALTNPCQIGVDNNGPGLTYTYTGFARVGCCC